MGSGEAGASSDRCSDKEGQVSAARQVPGGGEGEARRGTLSAGRAARRAP